MFAPIMPNSINVYFAIYKDWLFFHLLDVLVSVSCSFRFVHVFRSFRFILFDRLADCLMGLTQPKVQTPNAVKVEIFIFCPFTYAENKNTTFTAFGVCATILGKPIREQALCTRSPIYANTLKTSVGYNLLFINYTVHDPTSQLVLG